MNVAAFTFDLLRHSVERRRETEKGRNEFQVIKFVSVCGVCACVGAHADYHFIK